MGTERSECHPALQVIFLIPTRGRARQRGEDSRAARSLAFPGKGASFSPDGKSLHIALGKSRVTAVKPGVFFFWVKNEQLDRRRKSLIPVKRRN